MPEELCYEADSPSLFSENQVHDPAPTNVRPQSAAMIEDRRIIAAGVHEGIGEDRHAVEGTVLVDAARDPDGVRGSPARVEGNGSEGVREEVADQQHLRELLLFYDRFVKFCVAVWVLRPNYRFRHI